MAGRFPLLADAHLQQAVVEGLVHRGWNVERAIDFFPERTKDPVLLEHAVETGRVFVTNDAGVISTANEWLSRGRHLKLIYWEQLLYYRMSAGDFIQAFEALAEEEEPFRVPIRYIAKLSK